MLFQPRKGLEPLARALTRLSARYCVCKWHMLSICYTTQRPWKRLQGGEQGHTACVCNTAADQHKGANHSTASPQLTHHSYRRDIVATATGWLRCVLQCKLCK